MFDFLKKQQPTNTPAAATTPQASHQSSDIRRELVRVVLKNTLRLHGIPYNWIACEVLIIARAPNEDELHIQLVLMKWHEQLLQHALALQQELLLGLDRFDPSVDHSKYLISWRISPDCGCPVSVMPPPKFWIKNTSAPQLEEPLSLLDRRHTPREPAPSATEAAPGQQMEKVMRPPAS